MPVEAAANRVGAVEEFLRESLVYDRDAAFFLVFVITKVAAAQGHSHDVEVSRSAFVGNSDWQRAGAFELGAFDVDGAVVIIQSEREIIGERGVLDLRQCLCAIEHLPLKGPTASFVITLETEVE